MANRLPDEILKEILGPALTVSDDEFSCGRTTDSPFAYKSTSSAFVLLVCKQWMRVTTPLLYETVVIRSKAQAQALADAVKYNPHFGAYIRKLRMEGGYGMSPYTVISKSPNIKDIFISLDVYSDDNVNGLCKALPLTNPRRLILTKHTKATNLKLTKLINELMSCITSKWLCLETFESHASRFYMIEGYLEALKGCRSLTHIVLANCTEEFLVMLVEVANLKSIRITCQYAPWVLRHLVAQSPVLKQIVQFDGKVSSDDEWGIPLPPGPSPPPPLAIESKPGFTPLEDAPWPVADSIWSYIFSFATYPYPRVDLLDSDDLASEDFQHDWIDWAGQKTTACNISLVSKSFHTFIQPYLLHVVDLKDRDVASAVSVVLSRNPDRRRFVRILCISRPWLTESKHNDEVAILLTHLGNLVQFIGFLPLQHLKMLCGSSRNSLQSIKAVLGLTEKDNYPVLDLGTLPALLSLKCSLPPDDDPELDVTSASPPKIAGNFPRIWEIEAFNAIALFREASFPSLTRLVLEEIEEDAFGAFLDKNGGLVTDLVIDDPPTYALLAALPQLQNITIRAPIHCPDDCPECLRLIFISPDGETGHPSLTKATILVEPLTYLCIPDRTLKIIADEWSTVDFSQFPKLREIYVNGFDWPNTERGIKKTPGCTEFASMLKQRGITVYDQTQTPWRERAKVRRRA